MINFLELRLVFLPKKYDSLRTGWTQEISIKKGVKNDG